MRYNSLSAKVLSQQVWKSYNLIPAVPWNISVLEEKNKKFWSFIRSGKPQFINSFISKELIQKTRDLIWTLQPFCRQTEKFLNFDTFKYTAL